MNTTSLPIDVGNVGSPGSMLGSRSDAARSKNQTTTDGRNTMTESKPDFIHTRNAPQLDAHLSHAVRYGDFIFASGQIPIDPATGEFVGGDIRKQTRRVMENLSAVLEASGSCLGNVVKATVFLADINDFAEFDKTYREYFPGKPPARSTFGVSLAGPLAVEIEVIAVTRSLDGET